MNLVLLFYYIGWERIGSLVPETFYVTCIVSINETRIMLIVGAAAKTFYFDGLTNLTSNGPNMIVARQGNGCGTIPVSRSSTTQTVILVGGQTTPRSVEILDGATNTWRAGVVNLTNLN
jgi:hypothetical protein